MKQIIQFLRRYFIDIDKRVLAGSTLFVAAAIFVNYYYGLNRLIYMLPHWWQYVGWYGVFLFSFTYGYLLQRFFLKASFFKQPRFVLLLLIAPAIFAWKMVYRVEFELTTDVFKNDYWNAVIYWPLKVAIVTIALLCLHQWLHKKDSFYGLTYRQFKLQPYLIMLLIMLPLVAAASTQKDFLTMYPRLQNMPYLMQPGTGWHKLLYEISYGTDFFSIELFFRGFLVLAFARWAGSGAILPMAIFYCTIHFGKPMGECISSYFGGIILGVVTYHTRTILGGFLVHVGIAWLMELGGYVGNQYFK